MKVAAAVILHLAVGQTFDREAVGGKDRGEVRPTPFWHTCRAQLAPWDARVQNCTNGQIPS